ncbi:DsrE/DsrF/DrsH-like family protein [Solidesulfovibrio sp.]|uniref:DsrE/DsrF/DrsH-like family protein n=1 Tax=Solidesulfovibrio sp. TaxID=2910990 RepID=UPI002613B140|nr:DsrE/DsrF/DrsH-like family protein [Solidesulfovibrio sp.]
MDAGLTEQLEELRARVESLEQGGQENKLSMVVFSGDLDRALASFIIATGAAAMGMEVMMFFTFWGTPLLRDPKKSAPGKDMMGTMFGAMLPKGAPAAKLSKMHFGGLGTRMMQGLMAQKNVASLPQMIDLAAELGVRICICDLSMSLMGFTRQEMLDYPDLLYCGVATFLEQAMGSKVQLFI